MTSEPQVAPEVTYSGPAETLIKVIVYKEIKPGDLLKFQAVSNDAPTGGGARDLRFRPHERFDPIFAQLLPRVDVRRGKSVRVGLIKWYDGVTPVGLEAEYWPPTKARPNEGRWAKVHTFAPLSKEMPDNEGRLIIMLIQDSNNDVWLRIETETELRSDAWNQGIISTIFECIDSQPHENRSAQGYIDFVRSKRFCHAG